MASKPPPLTATASGSFRAGWSRDRHEDMKVCTNEPDQPSAFFGLDPAPLPGDFSTFFVKSENCLNDVHRGPVNDRDDIFSSRYQVNEFQRRLLFKAVAPVIF